MKSFQRKTLPFPLMDGMIGYMIMLTITYFCIFSSSIFVSCFIYLSFEQKFNIFSLQCLHLLAKILSGLFDQFTQHIFIFNNIQEVLEKMVMGSSHYVHGTQLR